MNAEFSSPEFWGSAANHVAVNPQRPGDADGLIEFAEGLGLRAVCFFQTSGSEGTPKWVALTKAAFHISGNAVNAHFEVTAADRWLVALPVHHVGGFSIHARAFLSGSTVVTWRAQKWEPREFAKVCEEEAITLTSLVPAQVHDLVRGRVPSPDGLRAAIIGGGGMTQTLADAAMVLGWRVFQSYGMTEAASQIATQPYNPFGAVYNVQSLEVLPHWQVAVDEAERLILRGPALALGYARRGVDGVWSWEALDAETGLRTRDLVKLWDHGTRRFLQFVGREANYVKILGELIHLAPLQVRVEQLALGAGWKTLPVIVALPDERRESKLVLVMEAGEGAGEEAAAAGSVLVTEFNAVTEPLCHLERVIEVARIPRSSLGKVDTAALQLLLKGE
jgi:O-succinylbenzoic acid--CoA ligase